MDEVRQIWGSKVMDGLKCKQEDFEFEAELNREPVELLEDRASISLGFSVKAWLAKTRAFSLSWAADTETHSM